jgi:hypothetical protein
VKVIGAEGRTATKNVSFCFSPMLTGNETFCPALSAGVFKILWICIEWAAMSEWYRAQLSLRASLRRSYRGRVETMMRL